MFCDYKMNAVIMKRNDYDLVNQLTLATIGPGIYISYHSTILIAYP